MEQDCYRRGNSKGSAGANTNRRDPVADPLRDELAEGEVEVEVVDVDCKRRFVAAVVVQTWAGL